MPLGGTNQCKSELGKGGTHPIPGNRKAKAGGWSVSLVSRGEGVSPRDQCVSTPDYKQPEGRHLPDQLHPEPVLRGDWLPGLHK